MDVESENTVQSPQDVVERSPRTHVDSQPLPTDSMVTVPLSESDGGNAAEQQEEDEPATLPHPEIVVEEKRFSSRPTSLEILGNMQERNSQDSSIRTPSMSSPTISLPDEDIEQTPDSGKRGRSNSNGSDESAHVDWVGLEKKEEQEPQEDGQDEAMALLLARLEQENNALLSDKKSATQHVRSRSQSRPPSISELKRLVEEQDASQVRYSQLPSPPPMTQIEFWTALARDYPQTVQRLPTLTLNKIRGGIPDPIRGVVWQSASGARVKLIEDQYDTLCGESSPYENIINKDLGRSFPGVEMFKDPEGEGQKMLGRVLKCFSLYDHKIGYCQGLGFLVGPLLMKMGEKEDYDLRSCFLPDLSGLHLRIYQFQRLLQQHMPQLAAHLESLQVESAYLSQWFLSFFAVTCPLPMLFRIYDVLFAEGASETIMRVALALMKRNEQKIIGLTEFEDVMQLLLGRALWDPYGLNAKSADDLVNDFVSFTNSVTRESLQGLEASFKEAQEKETSRLNVQKSATSFLGRLWGPSNSSTKSAALSPGLSAPSRPISFLRRTPSKQSLASTLNSTEGSDTSTNTQSTALTDISRGSGDAMSLKSGHGSTAFSIKAGLSVKDRDLHYQIEQLLLSVSQLQRQNSELEAALQKQREDRKEDHRIVRTVLDKMRNKQSSLVTPSTRQYRRRTTITAATVIASSAEELSSATLPQEVEEVAEALDKRFPSHQSHHRASSMFETKEVLRDSLSRTKEQLSSETIRAQALARELSDREAELNIARDAIKDTRHRLQESYNQSQKLEKAVQDLRQNARKGSVAWTDTTPDTSPSLSRSNTADSMVSTTGGLRELRLGRSGSTKSQKSGHAAPPQHSFTKRSSSLATQSVLASTENQAPADNEALLLELVNAKTAEAVAKQELEEMRNKFDSMRRAMGVQTPGVTASMMPPSGLAVTTSLASATAHTPAAVSAPPAAGGWTWGGWKRTVSSSGGVAPQ
ncbi:rab-GTPase-TBC domain-containing protein [Massariosphaeria phaeospora]|uniref:Rab-GTPase-TBC domain-containing protein n=1 Tax=Massariosphaeria phaeospora TaxID=100035 RepID=A0A7C8IC55_9PLEO|nr:rab-GTPase-TBC domain-containing protein [Massariosphaeria phaeospora]